jgi:hypothetical protein
MPEFSATQENLTSSYFLLDNLSDGFRIESIMTAKQTTCSVHPKVKLVCPSCVGSKTSEAKSAASRENGKLGGRPKKQ